MSAPYVYICIQIFFKNQNEKLSGVITSFCILLYIDSWVTPRAWGIQHIRIFILITNSVIRLVSQVGDIHIEARIYRFSFLFTLSYPLSFPLVRNDPHILCSGTPAFIKCGPLQYADRRCANRIIRITETDRLSSARRWSNSSFFSAQLSGCFDGAAGCFITFTRTCRISVSACNLKWLTREKSN